ncbi:hypothetical protein, conserved [Eimeria acervulina]|uniref:AP2/ERF domain-containing protein n=1 Tax=Eimeria acervulina TaxID=5801 RepID=U6GRK3_EIMAC|nr:hypothetical protein, conserved [Eimeria acervulina]CDI82881.1 hypothetical protein, conserved [Eimeria acervulina]
MAETGVCSNPSSACSLLSKPLKPPRKCLCGNICHAEGSDEDSTPTTAPQTPSSCEASEGVARRLRCIDSASMNDKGQHKTAETIGMPTANEVQQGLRNNGLKGGANLPKGQPTAAAAAEASQTIHITLTPAPKQESSATSSCCPQGITRLRPTPSGSSSIPCMQRAPAATTAAAAPAAANPSAHGLIPSREEETKTGAVCAPPAAAGDQQQLQQLLEEYSLRRSAFERNSSQRYERVLDSGRPRRRSSALWNVNQSGSQMRLQAQAPSGGAHATGAHARRRGQDGETAEAVTSSSGEEASCRANEEAANARDSQGSQGQQEGGAARRSRGGAHRSFPYRQFHVHHFLPEPQNKVGLLTHPTPAQFNKYPKARGVWFDPHRNLVRTCWKENGKARTMGFPVNKFGLEEARTLAVEYHYYKCPTDPLPDDLLSLVPRKPPHAYGWC